MENKPRWILALCFLTLFLLGVNELPVNIRVGSVTPQLDDTDKIAVSLYGTDSTAGDTAVAINSSGEIPITTSVDLTITLDSEVVAVDVTGQAEDYLIEVAKGNVSGCSLAHKFGRNSTVPNGSWEGILETTAQFNWLSAVTTVRIKAGGNAADAAAGAGAREIMVLGLDDSGTEVSEAIATAGASASAATTAIFWRVFRAYVTAVGTYGVANIGDIVIENSAGGTDLLGILAGQGQSEYGAYSIPAGKTGYLLSVSVAVDAGKAADIRLFTRENLNDVAAPMSPKRLRLYWDAVLGQETVNPRSPILSLPAYTDIWLEANGGGAQTEVDVDFEILLVDN